MLCLHFMRKLTFFTEISYLGIGVLFSTLITLHSTLFVSIQHNIVHGIKRIVIKYFGDSTVYWTFVNHSPPDGMTSAHMTKALRAFLMQCKHTLCCGRHLLSEL